MAKLKKTEKKALKEQIKSSISGKLRRYYGKTVETATPDQLYKACAFTVRDEIMEEWAASRELLEREHKKELYYLSFEFLMGRALGNNIMNIMQTDVYREALSEMGIDLSEIEDVENDAGLGNGGLGRLAACFLDSLSNLELPAFGCGIRYEYGLFKQKIVDGYQIEMPDPWLEDGNVWEIERSEDSVEVHYNGQVEEYFEDGRMKFRHVGYNTVIAEPYDMPISGYDSKLVNTLRLWKARSPQIINMSEFNRGDYAMAVKDKELAEVVSQILYPEDNHYEGKLLRLKQQYFFVSATIQWILAKQKRRGHALWELPKYVQIHINDTHPTIAIPEMMRILMDEEGFGWDEAWEIVQKIFAYTNHTIMTEALEKWPMSMVETLLPRVAMIIKEIDRRQREFLVSRFGNDVGKIEYMAVISNGNVNMANLCLTACHSINGVAALHTEILKHETFRDYFSVYPDKFKNVTNGVTPRRWLLKANPELAKLVTEAVGDGWIKNAEQLEGLLKFSEDAAFREKFAKIKQDNKLVLADYIKKHNGIVVDPNSLFDVQIKRLHEYKRQLLNVLQIIHMYNVIKDNPNADITPRTFIFAAKASAGYMMAKQIIRLISAVSDLVNSDPVVREKIRVVFIEDYKVSLAEIIIPAAEISEQISIAGKEASGTGNMKLMINGAVTLGTLDGANVEIFEQVGKDNIFLFGMTAPEVEALWQKGYYPNEFVNGDLKRVLEMLINGTLGTQFEDIYKSLLTNSFGTADAYMTLADFDSYKKAQEMGGKAYLDKDKFTDMSLVNIAKAGIFSSDRAIKEYADNIWDIKL